MNRVEYDAKGMLDEVVTDAGMHLERMDKRSWFLTGTRSDGSQIGIWLRGDVLLVEESDELRACVTCGGIGEAVPQPNRDEREAMAERDKPASTRTDWEEDQ